MSSVFPDGSRIELDGNLTSDDPSVRDKFDDESRVSGRNEKRSAVFIGGGGAIGAVLGGILRAAARSGHRRSSGAGAGVAGVLLSKGEEAQVPQGTPFAINLTQPIEVRESQLPDSRSRDYDSNDSANDTSYPSRDSSGRDPYPSRTLATRTLREMPVRPREIPIIPGGAFLQPRSVDSDPEPEPAAPEPEEAESAALFSGDGASSTDRFEREGIL